jgi:hypothetical protein
VSQNTHSIKPHTKFTTRKCFLSHIRFATWAPHSTKLHWTQNVSHLSIPSAPNTVTVVGCARTHDEHVSMSRVRFCSLTLATADTCYQDSVKLLHVCSNCSLASNIYVKHLPVGDGTCIGVKTAQDSRDKAICKDSYVRNVVPRQI